ncbi:hypothetical protein CsatB_028809 [Cannabis sativa]
MTGSTDQADTGWWFSAIDLSRRYRLEYDQQPEYDRFDRSGGYLSIVPSPERSKLSTMLDMAVVLSTMLDMAVAGLSTMLDMAVVLSTMLDMAVAGLSTMLDMAVVLSTMLDMAVAGLSIVLDTAVKARQLLMDRERAYGIVHVGAVRPGAYDPRDSRAEFFVAVVR